ncbi:capsule assembly Wzi family protein [Porticoccaceae bacterium]|nr:capsule assembly Wzi family protein [Porticoccaceae bacterium]
MCAFAFLAGQTVVKAEPWVDTRDAWLRADIERLAQAGVIKVPINTWPLMWGSVMNDLEAAEIKAIPTSLHGSLGRLLSAGKDATRTNEPRQSVRLSAATESQTFRHFGDDSREGAEFSVRRSGLTKHLAYNLEVTQAVDPWDGDKTHYDNSYFGFVVGNWIGLVGNIEKWWGPGWNSSIMLSNNASPTPGFTLHRNYSDPFELPVLNWLGPWTTNMFISKLDDERFIDQAKLVGLTVGFRPTPSLEVNLRRTAQWGGEGRPHGLKNFIKLIGGVSDNCYTVECRVTEPGNQLAGFDVSWDVPWINATVYGQKIGEDEHNKTPAKNARQIGLKLPINTELFSGMLFIEHDDTATGDPLARYNVFYNHYIYQTGYRYQGRAIGATWGNDSKVFSIGALGYLTNGDQMELRYAEGIINRDSFDTTVPSKHSVSLEGGDFKSLSGKWQRAFEWGEAQLQGRYTDNVLESYGRQEDKFRLSASVVYRFY